MSVNKASSKTKRKKNDDEFINVAPPKKNDVIIENKKNDVIIENDNKIENIIFKEQSINETLKKSFLKHLEMTFNVSQSLKRSGLSSKQYNLFLENDKEFNQAVKDLTNELIDFAQSKLYKFINIEPYYKDNDGNIHEHPGSGKCLNATKFLLERLGASHGWNGEPIPDLYKEKQDNEINVYIIKPDGTRTKQNNLLGTKNETD